MTTHLLSFLAGFGSAALLGACCALAWPRARRTPPALVSTLPRRVAAENKRRDACQVGKADSALPPSYWRGLEPMPGQYVPKRTPTGIFGTENQTNSQT